MAQNTPDVQQKVVALEQQAQKYLQEQKPALAIPVLREIVSLDTKNLDGRANLGVLLVFQGAYGEAIPHMRAALQFAVRAAGKLGCRELPQRFLPLGHDRATHRQGPPPTYGKAGQVPAAGSHRHRCH